MTLSNAAKELAKKVTLVIYLEDDNNQFFYLAIPGEKLQSFYRAMETGGFKASDYGTVLASGEGKPSEELKEKMEKEYGCRHDLAITLSDDEVEEGS